MTHTLKKEVLKMQKRKILANINNFGTKIFAGLENSTRLLVILLAMVSGNSH